MRRRTLGLRRVVTAAFACALAFAPEAGATEAVPALPAPQPKPTSSPYLLAGDRFLEANVSATLQLDWNGLVGVQGPTAHAGIVIGGEIGVPFDDQRVRPAFFSGVKVGGWADEVQGPFGFVEGARLRVSPFMWDVFDLYVVGRGDIVVDPRAGTLVRPGLGLGMRVARLLSIEATWDVTVPIGSTFEGTRHPDFIPYGVSFGALFDTCFQCNREAEAPVNRDLACRLYRAAATVGTGPRHGPICDAIGRAMIACPNLESASYDEDGANAFLEQLAKEVSRDDAKSDVRRLVELHAKLLAQWGQYELEAAAAARNKQRLKERWSYAPVPSELRAYLGCDRSEASGQEIPAPTCQEITK